MYNNLNNLLAKTQQSTTQIPFYSTSTNEKLRKRTLRSKITKILKDQFYDKCSKRQRKEGVIENNEEKIKRLQDDMYKELIHDPNFLLRPMVFSSYNSRQYLPGIKYQETQNLISRELLMDIQDQEEVLKIIKNQLTKDDLMEIGEDPAYFIQNPEIRELNWIDDVWLENKNQSARIKGTKSIASDSHLLLPKNLLRQLNYDPLEIKQQILTKRQQQSSERNRRRVDNFQINYRREQDRQSNIEDKLNKRYKQKVQQTDERLNALFDGVDHHKLINQQTAVKKQIQIYQNLQHMIYNNKRKIKQEDDEINTLTQKLRRVCIEKQVQVNVQAHLIDKVGKIKSSFKSFNK